MRNPRRAPGSRCASDTNLWMLYRQQQMVTMRANRIETHFKTLVGTYALGCMAEDDFAWQGIPKWARRKRLAQPRIAFRNFL